MQIEVLKVTGMRCGACTSAVTKALKGIAWVQDVKVSLPQGEATVQFDELRASSDSLKSAVRRSDYGLGASAAP